MKCLTRYWKTAHTAARCVTGIIIREAGRKISRANSRCTRGDRVIALVNNLGATPLSELFGVYNRLESRCQETGITIERNLIGSYCTSLDMTGFFHHPVKSG
ncbi:dihydroxyacetone kinase subunit DhaK [Citrobacter koseri]|uniref:Dihydroxyacetone kinase subunit DhaK n=1 Tax=Citrobacter koseri TaxID=545 RepID=A0A2X2XTV0_CITKO|nr:dihydroxyacetone kinase subunit DhaK [Citrobacter koseri]